ncbi:MAG: hypothetical protein EHM89_03755 [Acidobacteria bacterium]|nr:MAG: hypothetical protein EHM89_03755 [Acidobacteriota bacterium]
MRHAHSIHRFGIALMASIWVAVCCATTADAQITGAPRQALSAMEPRTRLASSGPEGNAENAFESAVADLRRLIEAQGAQLERQARIIETQGRDIETLRQRLGNPVAAIQQPASGQPQDLTSSPQQGAGQEAERVPEMPAAVVSAGDFPRSFQIPGTESAVRLGGQARMMIVHSLGPLGTDDRFVTSSIPVEGEQQPGENARTNYSANPSRVNLDIRTQGPIGSVRTFLEADFAGSGNAMRLRHAFIQTRQWIGGQTW